MAISVEALICDVSNSASIRTAAEEFSQTHERLDVLINNAGVYIDRRVSITAVPRETFGSTFHTNAFRAVKTVQAFLSFLRKSGNARVINVSSGYGQLDSLSADVPSYCLSNLNGATIMLASALKNDGIAVNSVCHGWVRTDMGGSEAPRSVEEGAAGIVWLAVGTPHDLSGRFFRDRAEIPW